MVNLPGQNLPNPPALPNVQPVPISRELALTIAAWMFAANDDPTIVAGIKQTLNEHPEVALWVAVGITAVQAAKSN